MGDSGSKGGGGKSRGSLPPDFPCLVTAAAATACLPGGSISSPSLPVPPCIDLIVNKWRPLTFEQCGQAQGRDIIAGEEQRGLHYTVDTACSNCPLVHLRREDGIRLILAVSPPWGRMPCRLTSRKVISTTSPTCLRQYVVFTLLQRSQVWLHTIM